MRCGKKMRLQKIDLQNDMAQKITPTPFFFAIWVTPMSALQSEEAHMQLQNLWQPCCQLHSTASLFLPDASSSLSSVRSAFLTSAFYRRLFPS